VGLADIELSTYWARVVIADCNGLVDSRGRPALLDGGEKKSDPMLHCCYLLAPWSLALIFATFVWLL
jgi:hypothetical protein